MCFWIFDIKEMTKASNKKNLMQKKTNIQPKVCAQDKNNQLKTNKQSTHHTRDSRNCTNTDGLTEWFKPWTIERFGENVRLLVVRMNELKTYNFIFHQITDEVVTYLYVFWLGMLNQILREIYSTGVITENTHCILWNPIVMK